MIGALAATVGAAQLVYGSDRPVVDANATSPLGPAAREAMVGANVARLLGGGERRLAVAA
jgi:predicted TIM-barrel fold metal-dependent hydrolase